MSKMNEKQCIEWLEDRDIIKRRSIFGFYLKSKPTLDLAFSAIPNHSWKIKIEECENEQGYSRWEASATHRYIKNKTLTVTSCSGQIHAILSLAVKIKESCTFYEIHELLEKVKRK